MSISFFVSDKKLTDKHAPVSTQKGTVFVRTHSEPNEHPMHAAKKSHDRAMEGEVFLNAVPDEKDEKQFKGAFNWKRGNGSPDKM